MPPQEYKSGTVVASPSTGSYWDEPPEQKLQGKTLSTLSLSGLERVDHDNEPDVVKEPEVVKPQQEKSVSGGYWDWQETMKKSLSKLSMSDLVGQGSLRDSAATSATEASTVVSDDNAEATKDEKKDGEDSSSIKRRPSSGSFWFWPNGSMANLAQQQDEQAQEQKKEEAPSQEGEEQQPITVTARRPSGAGGYWFWKNPSTNNLTEGQKTDSSADLETMQKNARESDRAEGLKGPISNLQHRMRSSWRASFHKLSSNSLSALTEAVPRNSSDDTTTAVENNIINKVAEGWKEDFSENNAMKKHDSFVVQEEGEEGMTF
ncbi:expressed unknown protein [Seminavis robusta]|uniref:Uncharacterized protein n=1 Tax=Seminavis robusta TaxID=568900 RepID=A0A9N8HE35_9STRA|nr:expressed unknown protein [Seminavis robusta]|eukprot:Sro370_g128350.1 n/a (319) ;mRNA; f:12143-13099